MSIEALVRAVLYEGFALYPYRPSALKNQRRFAFGVIYPHAWAARTLDPNALRVEVVSTSPSVRVEVRFLRLARRGGGEEQRFAGTYEHNGLRLVAEQTSTPHGELWRHAVEVRNESPLAAFDHEAAMDVSPASTHVILRGDGFISSIDPPEHAREAVASCRCSGLYPILAGDNAMLASPIILPDRPEIASQSPGDFFDGTEIDEMLTLRVLTMTDDEKREAVAGDAKIAAIIERTERLGIEATVHLHGIARSWPRAGSRVRVRPKVGSADIFDMLLAGRLGTVAQVDRDLEGKIHCAVTFDDDPGADLGEAGMPGHRFFFLPEELEVIG